MKKKIIATLLGLGMMATQFAGVASAKSNPHSTYVHGYYRSNGTYVHGYHRTVPNKTTSDNYSHIGNYNPWTHKWGHSRK